MSREGLRDPKLVVFRRRARARAKHSSAWVSRLHCHRPLDWTLSCEWIRAEHNHLHRTTLTPA